MTFCYLSSRVTPFFVSYGYLSCKALSIQLLVEFQPEEDWSNSDSDDPPSIATQLELPDALHRIRTLERKLASAKQDLADYHQFVGERLKSSRLAEVTDDDASSTPVPARDDDSHYFESYGANGKPSQTSMLNTSHLIPTCRYPRSDDSR